MQLLIITFYGEGLIYWLESLGQTVFLPVLLLGIGARDTLTLLTEILVESDDKITLENS